MNSSYKMIIVAICASAITAAAICLVFIFFVGNQKAAAPVYLPPKTNTAITSTVNSSNSTTTNSTAASVQNIISYLKTAYGFSDFGSGPFPSLPIFQRGTAVLSYYQVDSITKQEIDKRTAETNIYGDKNCLYNNSYTVIKDKAGKQLDEFLVNSELADTPGNSGCAGVGETASFDPVADTPEAIYFFHQDCFEGCDDTISRYDVKSKKLTDSSFDDLAIALNKGGVNLDQPSGALYLDYSKNQIYSLAGEPGKNQIQIVDLAREKTFTIDTNWKFGTFSTSTSNNIDPPEMALWTAAIFFNDVRRGDSIYVAAPYDDAAKDKIFSIDLENGAYKLKDVSSDINVNDLTLDNFQN